MTARDNPALAVGAGTGAGGATHASNSPALAVGEGTGAGGAVHSTNPGGKGLGGEGLGIRCNDVLALLAGSNGDVDNTSTSCGVAGSRNPI